MSASGQWQAPSGPQFELIPLLNGMVVCVDVKILVPLKYLQIDRHGIVQRDCHHVSLNGHVNIFLACIDILFLHLFPDIIANVVLVLSRVRVREARLCLHGILKLIVVHVDRDDLDGPEDQGSHDQEREEEIDFAAASLAIPVWSNANNGDASKSSNEQRMT